MSETLITSEPEAVNIEFELEMLQAGQGKRFLNYLLDLIFFLIFFVVHIMMLGILVAILAPNQSYLFSEPNKLRDYFIIFLLRMTYYTLFEATTGRSLAKFITRTKVVTKRGENPGFLTIFIRSLCRYIPLDALTFLASESLGLHDKLSGTRVINCKSASAPFTGSASVV